MSYRKMMLATLVVAVMAIPALMSPLATTDGSSIGTIDTNAEVIDILNDPIMVLDVSDIGDISASSKDALSMKVSEGSPLIVRGDVDVLELPGLPQATGDSPDVSGVYYNAEFNATCMFTASGDNAMANATEWAMNIASEVVTRDYGGDSNFCWFDDVVENSNFKLYARSEFTKLGTVANENYYLIHHYVNPIVKNTSDGREISNVTVSGDMSDYAFSRLLTTSPSDSAVPDQTGSYTVGISLGLTGLELSGSHTWNYTSQYSTVDNDTDLDNGTYTIYTDFNEADFAIDDNMILEPGAAVAALGTSALEIDLTFHMQVRQKYVDQFWPWDPEWEYISLSFTKNVLILP